MKSAKQTPCSCGSGKPYAQCCGQAAPPSDEINALIALYNTRRYAELEGRAHKLSERYPDFGFGWQLLGGALQMQGKDALHAFQKTAQLLPNDAVAHYNLGVAQKSVGRLDEAVASYRRAISLKPDYVEAHYNLGNALKQLGRLEGAAQSYRRAVQLKPDHAEAHYSLGVVLQNLDQLDGAVASYRRALQLKPDNAEAHYNLGSILQDMGKPVEAESCYRRVLEIKPDHAEAHHNLGIILQLFGHIDEAVASYRRALQILPDSLDTQSKLLLTINYATGLSPADHLTEARQYGRMAARKVTARFSAWQCEANPERLRVGLVSGDLRSHPVGFFLESLLAHLDPSRVELIAYPTVNMEDKLSARIKTCLAAWKPLFGLNDAAAARLIHGDGVHVLIDLSGHTAYNRLPVFAWKPAPVQVTWLGLPATTGVTEMDYVLGDPWSIPAECEGQFSEAVWRLPESYVCLTVPSQTVEVGPLPALATGAVTFGSFNNLTKMNDTVVAVWSRILEAVPGSRLLLKAKQLSDAAVCAQTRQRFAAHGIAPERLQLQGILASRNEHLATYHQVDIALDTFPYPGVTTSVEALWMGVPVLSMQGDRFLSCTASSIAHNAGLPEWIAAGQDDYVAKAVRFSADLQRLAALRAGLREQVLASPLFDAPRFAKNFEDALWGMWQRYRE